MVLHYNIGFITDEIQFIANLFVSVLQTKKIAKKCVSLI